MDYYHPKHKINSRTKIIVIICQKYTIYLYHISLLEST